MCCHLYYGLTTYLSLAGNEAALAMRILQRSDPIEDDCAVSKVFGVLPP